jgi:hypothetical protein
MKDRYRPRMGQSPQVYIKRGDLFDLNGEDEEQVLSVYRNISSINRASVKPTLGKGLLKHGSMRGLSSHQQNPTFTLDPSRRLAQLSGIFNSERFLGIGWGNAPLDKRLSLETDLVSNFKRVSDLIVDFHSSAKHKTLQEIKTSLCRSLDSLDRYCRGAYFYGEMLSIVEQILNQEKGPGFSRSLQNQDFDLIERSLKEKLEHKYDYLDKVSRNIEVGTDDQNEKERLSNLSKLSPGMSSDGLGGRGGQGFSHRHLGEQRGENSSSNKYSAVSTNGRFSGSCYSQEEQQEFYQLAIGFRMQLDVNDPLKRVPISGLLKKAEEKQIPKENWAQFLKDELKVKSTWSLF